MGWKFLTLKLYLEEKIGKKIDLVTKNALMHEIKDEILMTISYI